PAIIDAVYGHQVINVESQADDPSSLLNWMRRMITVRRQHPAFGRGTMTLLYPRNRKVLAYIREYEDRAYLCVANLSDAAQAVELDLARHRDKVPVELTGRSAFPPVGDLPYMLTLPAYGFYWFALASDEETPAWHEQLPDILPEFMTLTTRDGRVLTALKGREGQQFQNDVLPQWLPMQRWFAAKDEKITAVRMTPMGEVDPDHALVSVDVTLGEEQHSYFLPLSARWGEENLRPGAPRLSYTLAKTRHTARVGALVDGAYDERLPVLFLEQMKADATRGDLRFSGTDALREIAEPGDPRQLGVEQSNISIAFTDQIILKLYRRLREGEQPDVEVARFLTETAGYPHTPAYLGQVTHENGNRTVLAAAFAFVANRGDAWTGVFDALMLEFNEHEAWPTEQEPEVTTPSFDFPLSIGALLGERTAQLHKALATPTDDPAFATEDLTADHLAEWTRTAEAEAEAMLSRLQQAEPQLPKDAIPLAQELQQRRDDLMARIRKAAQIAPSGQLSRIHGDYHLGQVLLAQNDVAIIDFEGEPARTLEERRAKSSPLRDVAGMLRSFDYAALSVIARHRHDPPAGAERATARIEEWRRSVARDFMAAYRSHGEGAPNLPDNDAMQALLDLFLLQKAIYETGYELGNRPTWVGLPLRGILDLLDKAP
ncbi:MAG: putative maltokinase, partial [Paracoccus sp. (in: a-proteobacteria)]